MCVFWKLRPVTKDANVAYANKFITVHVFDVGQEI